jgi:uncharacterized protein YegP (UPF0339 family)
MIDIKNFTSQKVHSLLPDSIWPDSLRFAERKTAMTYWLYKDTQGHWRWNLTMANNKKIADSGESYKNKKDCEDAIALVKSSKDAPIRER